MVSAQLNYLGKRPLDNPPDAHIVLSVVKNEMLRLPYFLTYYRSRGFDRFIIVDNDSKDDTCAFLTEQPDVMLYHTSGSFREPPGDGLNWKNALLNHLCQGRWILLADADELLAWSGCEMEVIRDLSARLTLMGAEALVTVMLDMYSDKPFADIGYRPGDPFIDYTAFFDRGPYEYSPSPECPFIDIWGGVRARLSRAMKIDGPPPDLVKIPFLRWNGEQRFISPHKILRRIPLAQSHGALLHFKLLDDVFRRCDDAISQRLFFADSYDWKVLLKTLQHHGSGSLFSPEHSVRYDGSHRIAELEFRQVKSYYPHAASASHGIAF